ncbi:barstar family protein [Pseudomonas carnis]|uniref:barstar family protein n=1 Tax=Pseudomonas carnis TaxID=2487355 RepID=UPI0027961CEA|nr:barstar family protein [Pseudomonas carnis]
MTRSSLIKIDLSRIQNHKELHATLCTSLNFPNWYRQNWDAFWDAITGLVEMPDTLEFSDWDIFSEHLPRDAKMLWECLAELATLLPGPCVAGSARLFCRSELARENVNDHACFLSECDACELFASKLAPTEDRGR